MKIQEPLAFFPWKNPEQWTPGRRGTRSLRGAAPAPSGLSAGMKVDFALCYSHKASRAIVRKIIHLHKPIANFEKTSVTREGGRQAHFLVAFQWQSGTLLLWSWSQGSFEMWPPPLSKAWSVCEGSMGIYHLCLQILKMCNSVNWWLWVGDDLEIDHKATESHFSYAWVPGGRLWPWGHCWRSQGNWLNLVAHSSPFHYLVFCGVSVYTHAHICVCVCVLAERARIRVFGTLGFRALTSWATCVTTSILSFPISKVGKPPNLVIVKVTWNKIWRALGMVLTE